jgi:hypothetical protein
MVKVTVAVYVPVAYAGSFTRSHVTDAALPALTEFAPAPQVLNGDEAVVLAVCEPLAAVPGAATVVV